VFIGFHLPAEPSWPSDGLSIHEVLGYDPGIPVAFDVPGQAQHPFAPATPATSHVLTWDGVAATATYEPRAMLILDVGHNGTSGSVLAITNQTSYVSSNAGFSPVPGTSTFLSGTNPDLFGFASGRADESVFRYRREGAVNPFVIFVYDIGAFGPELPLAQLLPGGRGVVCVKPASMIVAGIGTVVGDQAYYRTSFPGIGAWIAGFPLIQQAIEWDGVNGVGYASPCGRQVF
ncbi:MAG: hypothetical protein KDC98_06795, partial [Planctomycetes bacterium]|nr:hypothetical protein [Planctomycetota bacterium]